MLSASMCLRTSTCCEAGAERAGVRGLGDPPHPQVTLVMGVNGRAGGPWGQAWWGVPPAHSVGGPSPCAASPLPWAGRSNVLQESRELSPRVPQTPATHGHPPGVTSEPLQEEIVILGGQGGQHVLQILPKLWGPERPLEVSPIPPTPKAPEAGGLSPPPRQKVPSSATPRPVSATSCGHDSGRSPVSSLAEDRPRATHQARSVLLRKGVPWALPPAQLPPGRIPLATLTPRGPGRPVPFSASFDATRCPPPLW